MNIVHWVASVQMHDVGMMLVELCASQRKAGHNVFLASGHAGDEMHTHLTSELGETGWGVWDGAGAPYPWGQAMGEVPDVMHLHIRQDMPWPPVPLFTFSQPRVVMHLHGLPAFLSTAGPSFWTKMRHVDQWVCGSSRLARLLHFCGVPQHRIMVMLPGVQADGYDEIYHARSKVNPFEDTALQRAPIVICPKGCAVESGWHVLVEAAHQLLSKGMSVSFHLQDELPIRVVEKIALLGRTGQIRHGRGSLQGMEAWKKAALAVIPAEAEEGARALLIAMACGVPVVTTMAEGNVELVVGRQACSLVPGGAPEVLCEAIEALLSMPNVGQEVARAAHKETQERLHIQRLAKRLESVYSLPLLPRQGGFASFWTGLRTSLHTRAFLRLKDAVRERLTGLPVGHRLSVFFAASKVLTADGVSGEYRMLLLYLRLLAEIMTPGAPQVQCQFEGVDITQTPCLEAVFLETGLPLVQDAPGPSVEVTCGHSAESFLSLLLDVLPPVAPQQKV